MEITGHYHRGIRSGVVTGAGGCVGVTALLRHISHTLFIATGDVTIAGRRYH